MSNAPHVLTGLGDHRAALLGVSHVAAQGQGAASQAANFFGYRFNVAQGTGCQYHIGACLGAGQGDTAANAAPAAGDDGHAAGQVEALNNVHKGSCSFKGISGAPTDRASRDHWP